ncbi:MAG: ATP-binding cassette domain-containing protein [Hyphomonadaceae bacterium]|nr:ATP-binding cassette domain-containing protein [Hyphomonadaceae bacterium]
MQTSLSLAADAAPTPDRRAAVRLEGVTVGYDSGPDVVIGASMDVRAGSVSIVTGASGSGKSTLLHLLRTALAPREGRVLLLRSDVAQLPRDVRTALKRRIGYAAQTPVFLEDETLFDNVALPLNLDPASRQTAQDVMELLGFLGLNKDAGRRAGALSAGQRKLAALARALVAQPDIILADDPLAGVGAEGELRVTKLLGELSRLGAAVIVAACSEIPALKGAVWRLDDARLTLSPESVLKPLDPAR